MQLIEITSQNRRDFRGTYKCEGEGCEHTETDVTGYDDRYFHDVVTPDMKCKDCGKSTNDMGKPIQSAATKHSESTIV